MTDDQMRRFTEWRDGLTLDIVEQSLPAVADDLANWYCRNNTPALDTASFAEELRAALLRRICAWCGERIPTSHAFDTRAGDLKACGPTCCDRINEAHEVSGDFATHCGGAAGTTPGPIEGGACPAETPRRRGSLRPRKPASCPRRSSREDRWQRGTGGGCRRRRFPT